MLKDLNTLTEELIVGAIPFSPEDVKSVFEKKLRELELNDIGVDSVEFDESGYINVIFFDSENNELSISFGVDESEGSQAIIDDPESDEVTLIELSYLNPSVGKAFGGLCYINLLDLSWMTKSVIVSLLTAGDLDFLPAPDGFSDELSPELKAQIDAYGYPYYESFNSINELRQVKRWIVRGGKKQKVVRVIGRRKRRLTPRQKMALRRASRKSHSSSANRARKRSLQIRKRQGLDKLNKRLAGGRRR